VARDKPPSVLVAQLVGFNRAVNVFVLLRLLGELGMRSPERRAKGDLYIKVELLVICAVKVKALFLAVGRVAVELCGVSKGEFFNFGERDASPKQLELLA